MPETYYSWKWHRDYFEDLAIENECEEENPYIQEIRDYSMRTGDEGLDDYSIPSFKY